MSFLHRIPAIRTPGWGCHRLTSVSRFAYAENLQPKGVLFGQVPDQVCPFDISRLRTALGKIDQACTLRTEDVQPQA
jgi:hypothetical protein